MLRVRLLGGLAVDVDGSGVALPTGRPRSLFAWLALNRGTHRRSEVAARFWPDILDASARASLRTALWSLRRSLGPASESVLIATRDRVGIRAGSSVWTDVAAFDELVAAGELEQALGLCLGPLLPDLDDDWVLEARDEHSDRVGEVLRRLGERAEASGDLRGALDWTHRRVKLDPLDEGAHRDLIRRLAAAGERVQALKAYRRLRARLAAELGLAPSLSTRELARSLRLDDARATAKLELGGGERQKVDLTSPSRRFTKEAWEPGRPFPIPSRLQSALDGPFVGRASELESLRTATSEAVDAAEPRLVLLLGEAGIGKTRLIAELAQALSDQIFLYGEAEEGAVAQYRPFSQALAHYVGVATEQELRGRLASSGHQLTHLLPELHRRLPEIGRAEQRAGQGGPGDSIQEIVSLLGGLSKDAGVVLALDDVQWIDRSSAVTLRRLLESDLGARLLVVAACRHEELAPSNPLTETLAAATRTRSPARIRLEGLAPAEVEQLCERSPRGELSATIHAKSDGNPFFIKEMLRDLDHQRADRSKRLGVPDGIKSLVARRLGTLSDECARALTIAAVIGQRFELRLLERVSDQGGDQLCEALEEAERAGLLVEDADAFERFGFAHDLVRDALLDALTNTRRARIHARTAEALEELSDEVEDALPSLAHHWCEAGRAGDPDKAVDLAMYAAERASARREYGEAVELYSRGLAVVTDGDERRRTMLIRRGVDYMRLEHLLWVRVHGVRIPGEEPGGEGAGATAALDPERR